jgi:hypothetical protein
MSRIIENSQPLLLNDGDRSRRTEQHQHHVMYSRSYDSRLNPLSNTADDDDLDRLEDSPRHSQLQLRDNDDDLTGSHSMSSHSFTNSQYDYSRRSRKTASTRYIYMCVCVSVCVCMRVHACVCVWLCQF